MSGLQRFRAVTQTLLTLAACLALVVSARAQGAWPPAPVNPGDDPYGTINHIDHGLLHDSNGVAYDVYYLGTVANGGNMFTWCYGQLSINSTGGSGPTASVGGLPMLAGSNALEQVLIDSPPAPNGPPLSGVPSVNTDKGTPSHTWRGLTAFANVYGSATQSASWEATPYYAYKVVCETPNAIPASCHLAVTIAQGGSAEAWIQAPMQQGGFPNLTAYVTGMPGLQAMVALSAFGSISDYEDSKRGLDLVNSVQLTNGVGYMYIPSSQNCFSTIQAGHNASAGANMD